MTQPLLITDVVAVFKQYLLSKGQGLDKLLWIKRYLEFCKTNNVSHLAITYQEYMTFIAQGRKKWKEGSINNIIKAVRSLYNCYLDLGYCTQDQVDTVYKVKGLQVPQTVKPYLTFKEAKDLIELGEALIENIDAIKIRALLWFMFYTGLRRQEIIRLKRKDIDLKAMKFTVRAPTKNKSERVGYINKFVKDKLETYFEYESEKINAFNLTEWYFDSLMVQLKDFITDKSICAKLFRHSFAHLMVRNNVNLRTAQKLMGHKNIESTMVYFDPDDKEIERAYRDLIK